MISLKGQLINEDFIKWGKNSLIFLAPCLFVLILSIKEAIPSQSGFGAIFVYILNVLLDLFKKWYSENKY